MRSAIFRKGRQCYQSIVNINSRKLPRISTSRFSIPARQIHSSTPADMSKHELENTSEKMSTRQPTETITESQAQTHPTNELATRDALPNPHQTKDSLFSHYSRNEPAIHYFETLSEKDVYGELIDCYRLRITDAYVYGPWTSGIYEDEEFIDTQGRYVFGQDVLGSFQKFLDAVETHDDILPEWWNAEKRVECEKLAMTGGDNWFSINEGMNDDGIDDHYGKDVMKPRELRMLAEQITGTVPWPWSWCDNYEPRDFCNKFEA